TASCPRTRRRRRRSPPTSSSRACSSRSKSRDAPPQPSALSSFAAMPLSFFRRAAAPPPPPPSAPSSAELLRKVKRIEITTRRLVEQGVGGEYHSVFKGRGVEFAEVRPYQPGDDVRSIDWNVTARMGS